MTKIILLFRDNESVLCSANQACYHEGNLQPSFLFVCFLEGVGEERERVLGISEGVRHASNKDGFYIVYYNQAKQYHSLKARSGGRSGRQSFVSLVAPSL